MTRPWKPKVDDAVRIIPQTHDPDGDAYNQQWWLRTYAPGTLVGDGGVNIEEPTDSNCVEVRLLRTTGVVTLWTNEIERVKT